jgi:hypothetical protein
VNRAKKGAHFTMQHPAQIDTENTAKRWPKTEIVAQHSVF